MGAVIEAIETELGEVTAELERTEDRVSKLQDYKQRLETAKAELNGQGTLLEPIDRADVERVREAAKPRARKPVTRKPAAPRRPAPKPPPSPEAKPVASPVSSPQGVAAAAKGEQRRKAIIKLLEDRDDWVSPADIAEELDEPWANLKATVHRLLVDRRLEAKGATRSREYRIYEGETRPDENGARTAPERRVVEAIGSIRLTASEICRKAKIEQLHAGSILQSLVTRGVLVRDNDDGVPLYGVAPA